MSSLRSNFAKVLIAITGLVVIALLIYGNFDYLSDSEQPFRRALRRAGPVRHWPGYNATANRTLFVWIQVADTSGPRFGNQLFFYASLYGIGRRSLTHTPLWPDNGRSTVRQTFTSLTMPVDTDNVLTTSPNFRPVVVEVPNVGYSTDTEQLPPRNVTIDGYVQSPRYFADYEADLRRELTFNGDVLAQARFFLDASTPLYLQKAAAAAKGNGSGTGSSRGFVRVIVHVRRGDYTPRSSEEIFASGFPVPTRNFFNRSMSYFEQRFYRVQFVVLSDGVKWCRGNIPAALGPPAVDDEGRSRRNIIYSNLQPAAVDMAIASLCDHAIITIGSYGWWAAWFAGGITIRQRMCASEPTSPVNIDDFYKPDWLAFDRC